jgi:hypothetical protein
MDAIDVENGFERDYTTRSEQFTNGRLARIAVDSPHPPYGYYKYVQGEGDRDPSQIKAIRLQM